MTLYELQPDLTLEENYRAITHAQIDLAIASLTKPKDVEKGIYAARKCMKRLRGLARLFRSAMSPEDYERANATYRDVGRSLSDLRDAWVRIELLDNLPEKVRANPMVPLLREQFAAEYEALKGHFLQPERYEPVIAQLEAAKQAVDAVTLPLLYAKGSLFRTLEHEMRLSRRAALRLAFKVWAGRIDFDTGSHEWRKRVKRLWYAYTLLRPAAPELLDGAIEHYDQLGLILGDLHDRLLLYKLIFERYGVMWRHADANLSAKEKSEIEKMFEAMTPRPVAVSVLQDHQLDVQALGMLQSFLGHNARDLFHEAYVMQNRYAEKEEVERFMGGLEALFNRYMRAEQAAPLTLEST
jgi:CHAD domain-containing protein